MTQTSFHCDDTFIDAGDTAADNSAATKLFVGTDPHRLRALLVGFDYSSIADEPITDAHLALQVDQIFNPVPGSVAARVRVYRVTNPLAQEGSNWDESNPGLVPWNEPGASHIPGDITTANRVEFDFPTDVGELLIGGVDGMVRDAIAAGATEIAFLIVLEDESINAYFRFSANDAGGALRPALVVTHGAGVPCEDFPVTFDRILPGRFVEDAGRVLIEPASHEHVGVRVIEIPMSALNDTEVAQLIALWDSGRHTCEAFPYTPPGSSTPGRFVFADDNFTVNWRNRRDRGAVIRLLDVSRSHE